VDLFGRARFLSEGPRVEVAEPPYVASRLRFDCTSKAELFGLPVHGRRVSFCENVFYEFQDGRIAQVWSIIDKTAIAAQLLLDRENPRPYRPSSSSSLSDLRFS